MGAAVVTLGGIYFHHIKSQMGNLSWHERQFIENTINNHDANNYASALMLAVLRGSDYHVMRILDVIGHNPDIINKHFSNNEIERYNVAEIWASDLYHTSFCLLFRPAGLKLLRRC